LAWSRPASWSRTSGVADLDTSDRDDAAPVVDDERPDAASIGRLPNEDGVALRVGGVQPGRHVDRRSEVQLLGR
jgi:hypothetical protein